MSSTMYEEIMRLGPLRYYPQADAYDYSGKSANGTVHGGVTFGQSPLVKASTIQSALYDGSSGYITASDSGLPTGAQPFTLCSWVKPVSPVHYALISFGTDTGTEGAILFLSASSQLYLLSNQINGASSASALQAGHTYFCVGTFDGTNTQVVLGNVSVGTLTFSSTVTLAYTIVLSQVVLGHNPSSHGAGYYSGQQAHSAIFGYKLSNDQITRLYNVGMGAEGIVRGSHRSFGRVM